MINDAAWQVANRFAGMSLALLALITMSVQVSMWDVIKESELAQTISAGSILLLPFVVMYLTEKYLGRIFRN